VNELSARMSKIRVMPDALASQVAAGEVVERPAAVVRELVENSLDAGATLVEVHVRRGGSGLIRVVDNGGGMDREDALLCVERHATSKIRSKEDLAAIMTFGFRGEALPSIASVSRFRLVTKQPGSLAGTEVEIQGGKLAQVRECGAADGTTIEAANLFFNVPARRKFLRTEATEFAHVEHQVRLHAIANPAVSFTLVRDGQVVFQLPPAAGLLERIHALAGPEMVSRLVEVGPEEGAVVSVRGFIGAPGLSRTNRQAQLSFLNGRPIESPSISYGVREGYHTALMKGQHPVTYLFLEMDPHGYDVNVHPAKKEVRFHDGHGVREAVARAVARALGASRVIPSGHPAGREDRENPPAGAEVGAPGGGARAGEMWHLSGERLAQPAPVERQTLLPIQPPAVFAAPTTFTPAPPPDRRMDAAPAAGAQALPQSAAEGREGPPQFRILGVIHRLYVVMESPEGLVLMDQHAAHERVMFEKIRQSLEAEGVPTQRLLIPVTLRTGPKETDLIRRNLDILARLGIELEPFGPNTFKLEALPTFIKTDDPADWLDQVIEELRGMSSGASALRLGEDMIASTACRHAVKANDQLAPPELEALLRDLFACEIPYCCPHGRPTLIQIGHAELERKFGRRAPG
jgi:DNA mismatch repair protein MutL